MVLCNNTSDMVIDTLLIVKRRLKGGIAAITDFLETSGETADGVDRRLFLKWIGAGLLTLGAAIESIVSGLFDPLYSFHELSPSARSFQAYQNVSLTSVATLPDTVTRHWLGPAFWGNRLQDWRLNNGQIECLRGEAGYEVRTVGVLTREVISGDAPGHLRVRTGLLEDADRGGFCGFLIGVGAGALDYRAAALAQRGSGTGGGFFCAFETDGQVRFREHTDEEAPLDFAVLPAERQEIDPSQPTTEEEILLEVDILPRDDGQFDVQLTARDADGTLRTRAMRHGVDENELLGGISLVSSPPPGESGARWWFRDLRTGGEKISDDPDRSLGPILGTLFSLDDDTLKLSAQLVPIGDTDPQTVRLNYRPAGSQQTWRRTTATIETGYTALFRIDDWDAGRAWDYRVIYPRVRGEMARYSGRIPADPDTDSDDAEQELTIGLFSCTRATGRQLEAGTGDSPLPMAQWPGRYTPANFYFPYEQLIENAGAHDPDLLVFCGDQYYEGNPTRMETRVDPGLDALYKWFLWLWAFRELTRDRPTILLTDDHDVYQPSLWGDGGEKTAVIPKGGYTGSPEFVNTVQRVQCNHNPDPYDPTPVERDIAVYYTAFRFGGVDFAVLEDRKFKSPPPDRDETPAPDERELLGPRQEQFLKKWGHEDTGADTEADVDGGTVPKICLTQTCFACLQTDPDGQPRTSFESNGYPKRGRDRAVELLGEAGALVLAGDLHFASLVRHGIHKHTDGPVQFTGPAGASCYQRWFEPTASLSHGMGLPHTGKFTDGFDNKLHVLAVENPEIPLATYSKHVGNQSRNILDRQLRNEGYGIVRVNQDEEAFTIECWPWDESPSATEAEQFSGWPYRLPFDQVRGITDET